MVKRIRSIQNVKEEEMSNMVKQQRMKDNGTASDMRNEGDDGNEVIDLFSQLLAQAKDDGLQDRLDDLRDKGKV